MKARGEAAVSCSLSIGDPNSKFFSSNQETKHECELFKENVRSPNRGRNVNLLNHALNLTPTTN
ncbi:unnamed protein product [Eruca vesicaria subsp. sativa]|uniref:Uncharacterized protein n=1 Tax=Eruca vesicaria subsp. sativa TaxID=29727 RepID=A0ABC8K7H1_ERUVS|nr:unnamed protein product [Eruca vesicaria subsp. sativa]